MDLRSALNPLVGVLVRRGRDTQRCRKEGCLEVEAEPGVM